MARAKRKPAAGGGNPAVAPKAPATDTVAQGDQTGDAGGTLTGPGDVAGAGSSEGVIAPSEGSADEALHAAALAVLLARAEVDRLTADFVAKVDAASLAAWFAARDAFTAFNTDPDHLAVVAQVMAFLHPDAPIEAAAAESEADLVKITARSKDGKSFRRGGVAWTGDFKAVAVSPALAERIRTDPNLVVKG